MPTQDLRKDFRASVEKHLTPSVGFGESEAINEIDWLEEKVIIRHRVRRVPKHTSTRPRRDGGMEHQKKGNPTLGQSGTLNPWSPCSYVMLGRVRRRREIARPLLPRWTQYETSSKANCPDGKTLQEKKGDKRKQKNQTRNDKSNSTSSNKSSVAIMSVFVLFCDF